MLIFIIFAVVTLLAIVWLIVSVHTMKDLEARYENRPLTGDYYDKAEAAEDSTMGACVCTGMFLLITLGLGIAALTTHNPNLLSNKEAEIQLKQVILELNNTYSTLQATDVNDAIARSEVNTYNEKVRDFKTEVETHQLRSKNPWTNWYQAYYWNNISADDVQYFVINK